MKTKLDFRQFTFSSFPFLVDRDDTFKIYLDINWKSYVYSRKYREFIIGFQKNAVFIGRNHLISSNKINDN